jgi:hypothetical protein
MKRKERLALEEKMYDIINERFSGAVVVNNTAIDYVKAMCDFIYDKRIVELLKEDIINHNYTEIHKQFEKWLQSNYKEYTYTKRFIKMDNKIMFYYIWGTIGWVLACFFAFN